MNDKKEVIMTQTILSERLAKARTKKGYTQQQIAEFLECNRATVTNYENGKRTPDVDTIVKLAKLYEVSADYLLGLSPAESTDKDNRCKIAESQLDYKAEYKRLREENVKLSVENHFLRNAVVSMSIQLFGGAEK